MNVIEKIREYCTKIAERINPIAKINRIGYKPKQDLCKKIAEKYKEKAEQYDKALTDSVNGMICGPGEEVSEAKGVYSFFSGLSAGVAASIHRKMAKQYDDLANSENSSKLNWIEKKELEQILEELPIPEEELKG